MNNPFNIIDFELDHDTYVDLDEEEDEWSLKVEMYKVSGYLFSMIYSVNYIFSIYMIFCFLSVYLYRLITFFKVLRNLCM